jgi:DNA-binding transcriptional LysR family regulator
MRFKGLDLNLLVALDVLLDERSVARAAARLHLSQSATSGALARLREWFGDELLIPVGRRLMPTPRALILAQQVRQALLQIEGTIMRPAVFDHATARRRFTIIASDYVAITGLKDALRAIASVAPHLTFQMEPPTDSPCDKLERGEADFLAMPEIYLSKNHPSAALFTDTYCVVADRNLGPQGDIMTEAEFLAARHVSVKFPTVTPLHESWFVENRGVERDIAAFVGSFSAVPFLIVGTDRIALMHSRLAQAFCRIMPLRMLPCPIPIPPIAERLQWHRFGEGDVGLMWVRDALVAAFA